jgi:hypothetical protein
MKPILCVLDFSIDSVKVLDVAATISLETRAHLIILYPYRLLNPKKITDVFDLKNILEGEAKKRFLVLEKQLLSKKLSYEFYPEIGFIYDRVVFHAKKDNIGMVVIGSQQANTINTDSGISLHHFIQQLNIPLLLVPEETNTEIAA